LGKPPPLYAKRKAAYEHSDMLVDTGGGAAAGFDLALRLRVVKDPDQRNFSECRISILF